MSTKNEQSHRVLCYCGKQAVIKASRTSANPGKLFYGCANYGKRADVNFRSNYSQFFKWCQAEPNNMEYSDAISYGSSSIGTQTDVSSNYTNVQPLYDSLNNTNIQLPRDEIKEMRVEIKNGLWEIRVYLFVLCVLLAILYAKVCL